MSDSTVFMFGVFVMVLFSIGVIITIIEFNNMER